MKNITILSLLLFTLSITAQDAIIMSNNKEISAKVEEVHIETISYKKYDNLSGPTYHIKKSEVAKIVFENGSIETFEPNSTETNTKNTDISLDETQVFIVENISKYCYDHNGYLKNGYRAKIEGDYLRLTLLNKNKTKELSSNLYDFKSVYAFRQPDKRDGDLAYLNLHVPV